MDLSGRHSRQRCRRAKGRGITPSSAVRSRANGGLSIIAGKTGRATVPTVVGDKVCIDAVEYDENGLIRPIVMTGQAAEQTTGTFTNPINPGPDPWMVYYRGQLLSHHHAGRLYPHVEGADAGRVEDGPRRSGLARRRSQPLAWHLGARVPFHQRSLVPVLHGDGGHQGGHHPSHACAGKRRNRSSRPVPLQGAAFRSGERLLCHRWFGFSASRRRSVVFPVGGASRPPHSHRANGQSLDARGPQRATGGFGLRLRRGPRRPRRSAPQWQALPDLLGL